MVVLALAVLFANSYSTGQVTENARSLHSANSLLGSSAVLRAANNQAALFARDAALGTASTEARDVAIEEATRALDTFNDVYDRTDPHLVEQSPALDDVVAAMSSSSSQAMELASDGEYQAAFDALETDFEPAFQTARTELRNLQTEAMSAINETETLAGWVAAGTRFLAILLLPAVAIIIYRRIVRAQVRERRLEFEAKLEYERKLSASKDELLAGVSHQLRTPVTGIYGMADLLADGGGVDPETLQEFIGLIRREAGDLDRMVADLLATSRLDADAVEFKNEPFIVANAVEKAVAPTRKSGARVSASLDDSVRAIGDMDRVVHVLRNLLSNAHKHGGPEVSVGANATTSGMVEIVVEDNGAEPVDETLLFRDFAHGGSGALTAGSVGLGLSVARRLAQGMGGDVSYSREGNRTRFTLTLPALEQVEQPERVEVEVAS